jgi:pimeloyl-ACP methyl ester carboxylesterase
LAFGLHGNSKNAMRMMCCASLLACAMLAAAVTPGPQGDVVFDRHSPLTTTTQLLDRAMSPLTAARLFAAYAAKHAAPTEYTIDLAAEHFAVYVPPATPPSRGYGLLVFVPPWPDARVPHAWRKTLDENGIIFVTAAHSGNDAPEVTRRMPLALDSYASIRARYPVDPQRVYVGGFSGGARVALRLAIAYPDLFRGALLDGGSDDIGSALVPLPDRPLLRQAQDHQRQVYLDRTADETNAPARARTSMASARDLCIADVHELSMFHRGHEPADVATWGRGLQLLEQARPSPSADADTCRARVESEVARAIAHTNELVALGNLDEARKAAEAIDVRYAHLALPALLALWNKLPVQ